MKKRIIKIYYDTMVQFFFKKVRYFNFSLPWWVEILFLKKSSFLCYVISLYLVNLDWDLNLEFDLFGLFM